MIDFWFAIIGSFIAAVAGWFVRGIWARGSLEISEAKAVSAEQRLSDMSRDHAEAKIELTQIIERLRHESERRAAVEENAARVPCLESRLSESDRLLADQKARIAELETRLAEERKATADRLKILAEAQSTFKEAFKALSADALKSNNQSFLDLAKATLETFQESARGDLEARRKAVDELVRPLKESLGKVDEKLGEIERARVAAYSALNEQVRGLVETHLPMLRSETANLVKALRQPTVRGRWGEMQLRRVVEMAGMLDHCDFVEQESRTTDEGRLRPDLIVRLPGGKRIVVDAKAPLAAYLEAVEAAEEDVQQGRLADHARQVRDHMTALGRKSYWEQFEPTPELVVMFLPGEMFFSAALREDPALIEFGVNERVIPATPTTLIALLRAIAYGWRQEKLAENAQAISDLGKELYKRLADLAGHWSNVGSGLDKAMDAYNKATGTLESRVLVSARRFRDLETVPSGVDIEELEQIDHAPRVLQAPELSGLASDVETMDAILR